MEITNEEIARDWNLWIEYVDPDATMTREEFDAMSIEERLEFMEQCGMENVDEDDDELKNAKEIEKTTNLDERIQNDNEKNYG